VNSKPSGGDFFSSQHPGNRKLSNGFAATLCNRLQGLDIEDVPDGGDQAEAGGGDDKEHIRGDQQTPRHFPGIVVGMLVSDEQNGAIYRISYAGSKTKK